MCRERHFRLGWLVSLDLLAATAFLVMMVGCYDPDRALITRDGSRAYLVEDNPEVDRLLSVQKARDDKVNEFWREKHTQQEGMKRVDDMWRNPERYAPGRREFLGAMSQQPGVSVPEKTYARLLESSGAYCTPGPVYSTTVYIKVRVTSGPLIGQEGWVCEDDIARTFVMP
jgi:hypothetical protein